MCTLQSGILLDPRLWVVTLPNRWTYTTNYNYFTVTNQWKLCDPPNFYSTPPKLKIQAESLDSVNTICNDMRIFYFSLLFFKVSFNVIKRMPVWKTRGDIFPNLTKHHLLIKQDLWVVERLTRSLPAQIYWTEWFPSTENCRFRSLQGDCQWAHIEIYSDILIG